MIDQKQIHKRVQKVISDVKMNTELKENGNLMKEYRLDSLDVISFYFELEKEFDLKIPEQDISSHSLLEVENLIKYLTERTS